MHDFNNREQLLELKLQWVKYRIEAAQKEIQGAVTILNLTQGLLEYIAKRINNTQSNVYAVGLHLQAAYEELEKLKEL